MTIGKAINKLRTDADLSQEEFAALFGVSQQSVQKWENEASVHNDSFDFTKIYNIGDVVRIFFLGIAEYFAQLTGR